MSEIKVEIEGLDKLLLAFEQFKALSEQYMKDAGEDAGKHLIDTRGLRIYPPETDANYPPTPYYIRGRGMQRAGIRKPEYNDYKSERLGTQWNIAADKYGVTIGNGASYAPYVHGEEQAIKMGAKGWLKLGDTARQSVDKIAQVYQRWIDALLHRVGLT